MVTDNRVIFKSDQNRYSLTYLNFDFSRFTISHAPISETGVKGFKVPLQFQIETKEILCYNYMC